MPTTLHKSSSVGFIAPDLLLYMSAAGAGQPSGGIPRAYITELRREATVDLSVRIERTVRRGKTRHHLVVKNDSATPATGVVLGSAFGPHPVGVGCSTSAGSESRCRRESLGAGAEWRIELVPGWVTSPDLPIHVWVAARELDLDPADNQNPPIVDVPAGRSRAVVRR